MVYCSASGLGGGRGWEGSSKPFIVGVVLVTFFRCRGDMAKVDCEGHRAQVGTGPSCLPPLPCHAFGLEIGVGMHFRKWGKTIPASPASPPCSDEQGDVCRGCVCVCVHSCNSCILGGMQEEGVKRPYSWWGVCRIIP